MKIKLLAVIVIAAVGYAAYNVHNRSASKEQNGVDRHGVHQLSTTEATSQWVVVNKKRPIKPLDYKPFDLTKFSGPTRGNITEDESQISYVTAETLNKMFGEASKQGVSLFLQSGYRSYDFQNNLYEFYKGQAVQDLEAYSAQPGYSEHQTGLAVDIGGTTNPDCNVKACFASTPESKWLAENAHKYGYIIRYPEGKQKVTGYEHEPWHLRFVGIYLATNMKSKGIATLEEYFKLQ